MIGGELEACVFLTTYCVSVVSAVYLGTRLTQYRRVLVTSNLWHRSTPNADRRLLSSKVITASPSDDENNQLKRVFVSKAAITDPDHPVSVQSTATSTYPIHRRETRNAGTLTDMNNYVSMSFIDQCTQTENQVQGCDETLLKIIDIQDDIKSLISTTPPPAPPPPPPPSHLTAGKSGRYKGFAIDTLSSSEIMPGSVFDATTAVDDECFQKILDRMNFDALFGIIITIKTSDPRRDSGISDVSSRDSSTVSVLSSRRSHTIELILRQIRMTPEKIIEAVACVDDSLITSRAAAELLKSVASDTELALLRQCDELTKTEQSVLAFSTEPYFVEHLIAISFLHDFRDNIASLELYTNLLEHSLSIICECKQYMETLIHFAIKLVKAMKGSIGQSFWFRLDQLLKLSEVKSNLISGTSRQSLLIFAMNSTNSSFNDNKCLINCSKLDVDRLKGYSVESEMNNIGKGLQSLKSLRLIDMPTESADGLEKRQIQMQSEFDCLTDRLNDVHRGLKKQMEYYGGSKDTQLMEFLANFQKLGVIAHQKQ